MQFTTIFATALAAFTATSVNGLTIPTARNVLDVFVPTITSPVTGTVWTIGTAVNVTWDTSNAPENISNGAAVLLRKAGAPFQNDFLAEGFDLRAGFVTIVVPDVPAGDDYAITLFGDSGNISDEFSIVDA
ncbi:hypothetical protein VKT23_004698 [Stygiomarasmius scandens]|uniref:Yeast cell wall synthesis Kre9/Knh1-like N-terminal domain-containing protein n=1 Tax=Marasmiellus scandens TaxID=2682957 RepID=A0ABR1JY03_9AGAR